MSTIEDKLREIIMEHLGAAKERVQLDSKFEADLRVDSLDAVQLIMAVEEAFDITIEDNDEDEFYNCTTFKDAVDVLTKILALKTV